MVHTWLLKYVTDKPIINQMINIAFRCWLLKLLDFLLRNDFTKM